VGEKEVGRYDDRGKEDGERGGEGVVVVKESERVKTLGEEVNLNRRRKVSLGPEIVRRGGGLLWGGSILEKTERGEGSFGGGVQWGVCVREGPWGHSREGQRGIAR